jgi:hypothetical protein
LEFLAPSLDSPPSGRVSSPTGSGFPHFQQRGTISLTALRSAEMKFCEEQAAQSTIIGAILHFPAEV